MNLSELSLEDLDYAKNRIRYYKEMPSREALLSFLDEVDVLQSRAVESEREAETNEEYGYERAMKAVRSFLSRHKPSWNDNEKFLNDILAKLEEYK